MVALLDWTVQRTVELGKLLKDLFPDDLIVAYGAANKPFGLKKEIMFQRSGKENKNKGVHLG